MIPQCPACTGTNCDPAFESLARDHSLAGYSYSRCSDCGTVFIDPPPTQDALNDQYRAGAFTTQGAERYASAAEKYLDPTRYERDHAQYVAPLLRHKSGGALLDFACGPGWFTHHTTQAGFDSLGIDLDANTIAAADAVFEGRFRQGGLDTLERTADHSFDVVAVLAALEHVSDPAALVGQMRRVLKADGILLVAVPTVDSLQFRMLGEHYYWAMAPYHLTLFSLEGMRLLMRRTGFRIAESIGISQNWYWTKAIADKLGLVEDYIGWRKFPEFVRFDIEIDALFDRIAEQANAQSARVFVCTADGEATMNDR